MTREELHERICDLFGSRNVYFQPPENIKLVYPCVLYELSRLNTRKADGMNYIISSNYSVTLINEDPDELKETTLKFLNSFEYCSFGRRYVYDGLYHDVLYLYC